ncbi:uncharacterized protein [Drosophila takahashii]|uniref:uncharacterized protein n=1 Tax=Drosophila takahashii TaxID=29030 RepID=UPI003899209A
MSKEKGSRFVWSNEAVLTLFDLWQDNMDGFRGVRKNTHIYKEMANSLKAPHMWSRTGEGWTLGTPSTWEYFERVAILMQGSRAVDLHPTDSTDFSSFGSDGQGDEMDESTATDFDGPSGSQAKRRKTSKDDEFLQIEKRKMEVMEEIAKESANFHRKVLGLLQTRASDED